MENKNIKPIALVLGVMLGVLIGLLTDNLILWLCIGIALGAARANSNKCENKTSKKKHNLKRIALFGGLGYLIIFISGIYANFVVIESLKVFNDKMATFQNFTDNREAFFLGIASFIVMVMADLLLTWCLYGLFKPHHHKGSTNAAWFRLINVIFFGAALNHLFEVVQLTNPQEILLHSPEFLANQVNNALNEFNHVWLIGLLFFGVHLILLARLMLKHIRILRFIPILLMIAGFGYLADSVLQFTYSGYEQISDISTIIVVLPGVVGELSLTLWLLFYKENKNLIK